MTSDDRDTTSTALSPDGIPAEPIGPAPTAPSAMSAAPAPDEGEGATSPSPKKRSRETMQIRAILDRTGLTYKELQRLFMDAGIWKPGYRYFTKVNVDDALDALKLATLPPASPQIRAAQNEVIQKDDAAVAATLKMDAEIEAAKKAGKLIDPAPLASGTGNISDDPVPQAILDGDFNEQHDCFPYPDPANIPPDLIISALPNMQGQAAEAFREARISIGWRWVDAGATKLLNRLYPDGRWRRMVGVNGRIVYHDLALAAFPRAAWERRKARQKELGDTRIGAVRDSFAANITDAQRALHDRHGIRGDAHLQPITEDRATSDERAEFADRLARGDDPRKPRVGLGRASTSR